jgi:predicted CXXCH cytochrome family protein
MLRAPGSLKLTLGFILLFCCSLLLQLVCADNSYAARKFKKKECADCHSDFMDQYGGMKNKHPGVKNGQCQDCHLSHGIVGKLLLIEEGNKLCFTCHKKEEFNLDKKTGVHTALKSGKCSVCHNPHASDSANLLADEGNAICFNCHKEDKYQKKVIHGVIDEDGCRSCHNPHYSEQPNLLTIAPDKLCLSCHDSEDSSFEKAHGDYPVTKAACTTCHNPHSSENANLLKGSLHSPVAEAECDSCHIDASGKEPFGLSASAEELCLGCHDAADMQGDAEVQHEPFNSGDCLSCHDPHTSDYNMLLVSEGNGLCFNCHENTSMKSRFQHAPVDSEEGCLSHIAHLQTTCVPVAITRTVPVRKISWLVGLMMSVTPAIQDWNRNSSKPISISQFRMANVLLVTLATVPIMR